MIYSDYGRIITHRTEFLNYNYCKKNTTKENNNNNKKKEGKDNTGDSFAKLLKQECDKLI